MDGKQVRTEGEAVTTSRTGSKDRSQLSQETINLMGQTQNDLCKTTCEPVKLNG